MLRALEVSNFVLIEKASLELGEGFTALTGETGAGKSILVDAIELLVGGRGDAGLVREGAERAELSAEFEVEEKSPLVDWLSEADLAGDPGTRDPAAHHRPQRPLALLHQRPCRHARAAQGRGRAPDRHPWPARAPVAAARRRRSARCSMRMRVPRTWRGNRRGVPRLEAPAGGGRTRPRRTSRSAKPNAPSIEEFDFKDLKKLGPREGEWQQVSAEHTAAAARLEPARRRAVGARGAGRGRGRGARPARRGGEPAEGAVGARRPAEIGGRAARIGRSPGRRGGARAAQLRLARRARPAGAARHRGAHRGAARGGPQVPRAARRAAGDGSPSWRSASRELELAVNPEALQRGSRRGAGPISSPFRESSRRNAAPAPRRSARR